MLTSPTKKIDRMYGNTSGLKKGVFVVSYPIGVTPFGVLWDDGIERASDSNDEVT